MKFRVVWVGKTKSPHLAKLLSDYAARIRHFLPFEIVELKEPKVAEARRIDAEGKKILAVLDQTDMAVILDPRGKQWSSEQLGTFVQKHLRQNPRHLTFVIGGYAGLSQSVKERAEVLWSLTPLTLTHDLARVVLLEQVYRALSTIHNFPYAR